MHNWLPKLFFCLINMMMANAYRIYWVLVTERKPDCMCFVMKDTIKELPFSLMQRSSPMQTRAALHPGPYIVMSQVLGWTSGLKV
jgi:hypothetical protein